MKLCGWCEKRLWPWQHFAFKTNGDGTQTRYHTHCYQYLTRLQAQNQKDAWRQMQYEGRDD